MPYGVSVMIYFGMKIRNETKVRKNQKELDHATAESTTVQEEETPDS